MFRKGTISFKARAALVLLCFIAGSVIQPGRASIEPAQASPLPLPTDFVGPSKDFSYPVLRGLKIDPQDPFKLEFIIDARDKKRATEEEVSELIQYFLTALTMPEDNLWVNLSPYEKDRIIPDDLAFTEMGKGLLSQDYLLKQLTSSLTYPENKTGKQYWKKVYQEAARLIKDTDTAVDTFNKVWIVPESAQVYEDGKVAFITEARLKAVHEEDYLAASQNNLEAGAKGQRAQGINKAASRIMKEVILPVIDREINQGKNFAKLRQMYNSLILSFWFKKALKDSIYQYYIGKSKTLGLNIEDKTVKDKIYSLYLKSFKKGVYDYIKKDSRQLRRYYSGGMNFGFSSLAGAVAYIDSVGSSPVKGKDSMQKAVIVVRPEGGLLSSPINNTGQAVKDRDTSENLPVKASSFSGSLTMPDGTTKERMSYDKAKGYFERILQAVKSSIPDTWINAYQALLKVIREYEYEPEFDMLVLNNLIDEYCGFYFGEKLDDEKKGKVNYIKIIAKAILAKHKPDSTLELTKKLFDEWKKEIKIGRAASYNYLLKIFLLSNPSFYIEDEFTLEVSKYFFVSQINHKTFHIETAEDYHDVFKYYFSQNTNRKQFTGIARNILNWIQRNNFSYYEVTHTPRTYYGGYDTGKREWTTGLRLENEHLLKLAQLFYSLAIKYCPQEFRKGDLDPVCYKHRQDEKVEWRIRDGWWGVFYSLEEKKPGLFKLNELEDFLPEEDTLDKKFTEPKDKDSTAPRANPGASDYYERLGLRKDATEEEIKAAYRRLARKYHPDIMQGKQRTQEDINLATELFKNLQEAYSVLVNDHQREIYDKYGTKPEQQDSAYTSAEDIFNEAYKEAWGEDTSSSSIKIEDIYGGIELNLVDIFDVSVSSPIQFNVSAEIIQQWKNAQGLTFDVSSMEDIAFSELIQSFDLNLE